MSDDFGTVNVRGAERAREIDVLRQHYRRHRDALHRMIADAPTEALAAEYRRLADDIDRAIQKIEEIEGRPAGQPAAAAPAPAVPPRTRETVAPQGDPLRNAAEPGMRQLHPSPGFDSDDIHVTHPGAERVDGGGSRVLLILGAAVIVLAAIGWLVWRASSDRGDAPVVTETAPPAVVETSAPPPRPEPAAASASEPLLVTPPSFDYGIIRKGTRATRRYEVTNQTEEPVTFELARSTCRCLYYDYDNLIPPKAKQGITVTVDGAKARAGSLQESIKVSSKSNPAVSGTLELVATIE